MRQLFLHEFRLGHNTSHTAANINKVRGEILIWDRTVRRWCQKFRCGGTNLEDQEGRRRLFAIDDQHLKTLVEQKARQSVRETSQAKGVSISIISDHVKKIGKVKNSINGFHMNSVKVKELDVLNGVRYYFHRN